METKIEKINNKIIYLKDLIEENQKDIYDLKSNIKKIKTNFKYILKDSHNTYISIHNTEDEVYSKLHEFSKKFNDTFSTLGGSLDGSQTFEDSAVFTIPDEMKKHYNNNQYIKFYFFKFDLNNNEMVNLYN